MKESLSPYIDSFLTMIAVEKGLAKNTVEAYSRDLVRLSEFLVAQSVASWDPLSTEGSNSGVRGCPVRRAQSRCLRIACPAVRELPLGDVWRSRFRMSSARR